MPDPLGLGSNYLAMLGSSKQTRIVRVDVHDQNGQYLATLPNIDSGSVTVDITAKVRRTCQITIEDRGLVDDVTNSMIPYTAVAPADLSHGTSLIPGNQWGSLLHPLSQNELYIYRGFEYADGSQDLIPLGIFRMTSPEPVDSGSQIAITITGQDRSATISRFKWTGPYQIQSGTLLETAVATLLNNRWPSSAKPLDMSLIGTTVGTVNSDGSVNTAGIQVPATTFGADISTSNDPWVDVLSLITVAGMELYFDTSGRPVMKQILDPTTMAGVFPGIYQEGNNCKMNKVDLTLDETSTVAGVIAIGNGTGNGLAPVTSMSVSPADGNTYIGVWNTDPDSPTYYDPGNPDASFIGEVPYIFTTQAIPGPQDSAYSAQVRINAAALAQLQLVMTAFQAVVLECVPNAALWENDVIPVARARLAIDRNFQVQKIEMPLDVQSISKVTLLPQASPTSVGN